jgi:hypothetical protein
MAVSEFLLRAMSMKKSRKESSSSAMDNAVESNYDNDKLSKLSKQQPDVCRVIPRFYRLCFAFTLISFVLAVVLAYYLFQLFPEYDMIVYSSCKSPRQLSSWNGKLFGLTLWKFGFKDLNSTASTYSELSHDRRRLIEDNQFWALYLFAPIKMLWPPWQEEEAKPEAGQELRPVIFFGTHHKTGTMIAKKLFASICVSLDLCCVFRVTRDSVRVLQGNFLLIYMCNFHVLNQLLLIYIC